MTLEELLALAEGIPMERRLEILQLSTDAIQMLLLEIEEGDSSERYKALTPDENKFFWAAIQDAVADTDD